MIRRKKEWALPVFVSAVISVFFLVSHVSKQMSQSGNLLVGDSFTPDLPAITSEGADWRGKTQYFNPYVSPPVDNGPVSYAFSVTPSCDQSINMVNLRRILKLKEFWKTAAFQTALYMEHTWIGAQVGYFVGQAHVVAIVPPCFFPALSDAELDALNSAVYVKGMSLLIVGGLQGADFLAKDLQGKDGVGYTDGGGSGSVDAGGGWERDGGGAWGDSYSPRLVRDAQFSDGPFYLQEDAVNTMFFYGPKMLESAETVVGIPASDLPANTKHYYMSADEISVVFEIPAGNGRIMFIGYDYISLASRWIDVILLAQKELQSPLVQTALSPARGTKFPQTAMLCPQNSFCPQGSSSGTSCPSNTGSPGGSTSLSDCSPTAGHFGKAGRAPQPCPQNAYCPRGSSKPTPCPAYTTSQSGAKSKTDCRAAAGYHHGGASPGGAVAIQCPKDSYCPAGSTTPWPCPARTVSPPGSKDISACRSPSA